MLAILYFVNFKPTAFTFHFAHANMFHLFANLLAASIVVLSPWRLVVAYLVVSVLYLIHSTGAIGFSGIIYFLWGTYLINEFIYGGHSQRLIFAISIVLATSFFIPNLSFYLHASSLALGVVTSAIIWLVNKTKNDLNALKK